MPCGKGGEQGGRQGEGWVVWVEEGQQVDVRGQLTRAARRAITRPRWTLPAAFPPQAGQAGRQAHLQRRPDGRLQLLVCVSTDALQAALQHQRRQLAHLHRGQQAQRQRNLSKKREASLGGEGRGGGGGGQGRAW